jgi:hypothetical protein
MSLSLPNHTSCQFIDCNEPLSGMSYDYCEYHSKGGMFGGESYEQYQIIEQDFIDFIRVVPLEEGHFKVHSPILRDIIIRTCVQIEIFFKEWAKLQCTESPNSDHAKALLIRYNHKNNKKERNWNIGDFFGFQEELNSKYRSLHIMPLNKDIKPFDSWLDEKNPPKWWDAYNGIKHGSSQDKKIANLEIAMHTLAGLFTMHCVNWRSSQYLINFNNHQIDVSPGKDVTLIETNDISTPLDSKKYLFKEKRSRFTSRIKLVTKDNLENPRRGGI